MAKEDKETTTFITSQGIFCYTKMPFGLRNAGATYQRLVDKAFHKQIRRNLKVYVDDLVIKSRTEDEIVRDIEETFKTLREINMKLNPKKCTFGVEEGMFLGYKVSTKGLKVCPDKVDVVLSLPSPKCLKDVRKLNGKLAILNSGRGFQANEAANSGASHVNLTNGKGGTYRLFGDSQRNVPKEILSSISNHSNHGSTDTTGVIKTGNSKEATEIEHRIGRIQEDSPDTLMEVEEELPEPWVLFTVGSSSIDGSGAGLILTNPEGIEFTYALRFRFDATNNEAEYEALIAGLRIAEQMSVKNLQANVDSRLVANQVNGTYVAKEVNMIRYLEKVRTLTSSFKAFSIRQVPRSENKKVGALSKIASTSFAYLSKQVLLKELKEKSISEVEILVVVEEEEDTRMTPIFEYLTEETLPADVEKARAVRRKSQRFAVINGTLYKKSFPGPWLRCVGPLQANYDARALIRACQDCQVHKPVPRNPQQKLTPITSPWPFYKWGIDIAGPFSEGPGKVKFLIVAMDYFTKFGLPGEIISDNGKQFRDNPFKDWNKNWMEELSHVLWAHRTMIKSSNGDTPFSLTYRTEAVIPAEIGMPTLRTAKVDLVQNNEALEINLDLLEERREQAAIREAKSKARMKNTITPKSEVQASNRETLCTATTMQAVQKTQGS
ncbi:reverse transcriptase domain-containing protein [Tanacetum coccineum]